MGIGFKSAREPGNLVGFPKEPLVEKGLGSAALDASKRNILLAQVQMEKAVERKREGRWNDSLRRKKKYLKNSIFILCAVEENRLIYTRLPLFKKRANLITRREK